MVRGLRIFLPFPFTRNPVSSHLSVSILKREEKRIEKIYVVVEDNRKKKTNNNINNHIHSINNDWEK